MAKIIECRRQAIRRLDQAGVASARLDVDLLLEQALGLSPLEVILAPDREMSAADQAAFEALLRRRLVREPVSQIVGRKDFWSLSFKVTGDCLTPRPDSETLIEAALAALPDRSAPVRILDLGTGSGCLLLSLMAELPNSRGTAVDISGKALAVARENASALGFAARCEFILSDWAAALPKAARYDLILCNPPYIACEEAAGLDADVRDYEPPRALFAGDGGLAEYKRLARIVPGLIMPGGHVFLEIGHLQGPAVREIFSSVGVKKTQLIKDLGKRDRCVALHF